MLYHSIVCYNSVNLVTIHRYTICHILKYEKQLKKLKQVRTCIFIFPLVREYVADQGYGLDTLVRDKDSMVRCAVAEQGYGYDILLANGETNEKVLERIKK